MCLPGGQEAEERRLEAVKQAIAGATQNALAEKMARRKALQSRSVPAMCCTDDDPMSSTTAAEGRSTTPAQIEHEQQQQQQVESRHVITPGPGHREHSRSALVDAEVQTDQQQQQQVLQIVCRCDNNTRSRQQSR